MLGLTTAILRSLAKGALLPFLMVLGFAVFLAWPGHGHIVVVNASAQPILKATVSVCGQNKEFTTIPSGNNVEASYNIRGDSSYTVNIEFASHQTLSKTDGYVTSTMDDNVVITVFDGSINIEQKLPR